jgi:hypothetical protein
VSSFTEWSDSPVYKYLHLGNYTAAFYSALVANEYAFYEA